MKSMNDERSSGSEEALRVLFEQGSRRLQPPAQDAEEIRKAVHAEWSQVARNHRRGRQFLFWALAASVVLAIFLGLRTQPIPTIPVIVATAEKSIGQVLIRQTDATDQSSMTQLATNIMTGQTIVTGADSALALSWSMGGSLRLDQKTQLIFVSPITVELIAGRIYFDSKSNTEEHSDRSSLTVQTPVATVRHVGTQFMTKFFDDSLTVSVREGAVSIEGLRYDATARAGQRIQIQADGDYTINEERGYGTEWQWVESIAPTLNPEGRTVLDFLNWVSRESGRSLKFESAKARLIAASSELRAPVLDEPTRALEIFLQTTDLKAETVDDVISVSLVTAGE